MFEYTLGTWILISILVIWTLIWKGFALWHSARRKHITWFIIMLILNTAGILPIIYLAIHVLGKKEKNKKKIIKS